MVTGREMNSYRVVSFINTQLLVKSFTTHEIVEIRF